MIQIVLNIPDNRLFNLSGQVSNCAWEPVMIWEASRWGKDEEGEYSSEQTSLGSTGGQQV